MLDVKRSRTDNTITNKDREQFEEELFIVGRASDDVRPSDVKAAKEVNSMLGEQVLELQEEREKLLGRISELEITVSELNNSVLYNIVELKTAKKENEVLRCSLEETVQEAQALRVNLGTKTQKLKFMETHAENINNESDFYKRSRADTDWLLQKKREENTLLKEEVSNRRRISSINQEETQHLANDLFMAETQIKILTKRLQGKEDSLKALQEDNIRLADEVKLAKSALESKIIELNDTKQEVEFLRSRKGDTSPGSIFQVHRIDRMSRSEESSRNLIVPPSRRSDPQQNLFVMLQNLSRASDMFASNTLDESKLEEANEQKIDILNVYAHLTAAAVKTNYPDIDFPNADLVRMGENLPFWELYPYYTHFFETMKEDSRKRSSSNRKTGRWFRWMTKGEQAKTP